ncbi:1633_t:CDS:10 [Funneliformis geosporum]|nr:1633_t:CDS:10 [Funneliformis geosporum]
MLTINSDLIQYLTLSIQKKNLQIQILALGESNSGVASHYFYTGINAEPRSVTPEQYKCLNRDPSSNNIQGVCQEMNEYYKGEFSVHSLLRVDDTMFEPLGDLIRMTEGFFLALIPVVLDNNQQRFNTFGETTLVHNTPFDRYQFGSILGEMPFLMRRSELKNNAWDEQTGNNKVIWPVSAPITNAPFIDALMISAGWPTTPTEQPTHLSSLASIQFFACYTIRCSRQYEIMDENSQDPSIDHKINDVVKEMMIPLLGDEILSTKVDEKMILKSPSLREIQEMEAQSTPSNSSWGIIGPNLRLEKFRKKEEGAMKNVTVWDTLCKYSSSTKPESISMNTAWTTVTSKSSNRVIIQPNNATINVMAKAAEKIRP